MSLVLLAICVLTAITAWVNYFVSRRLYNEVLWMSSAFEIDEDEEPRTIFDSTSL